MRMRPGLSGSKRVGEEEDWEVENVRVVLKWLGL